jgi:hypothetical protein
MCMQFSKLQGSYYKYTYDHCNAAAAYDVTTSMALGETCTAHSASSCAEETTHALLYHDACCSEVYKCATLQLLLLLHQVYDEASHL